MIRVFQPSIGATEFAAVRRVFDRAWLGEGDETAAFVAEFAAHLGVDPAHLVPVSCATEGLFQVLATIPRGRVIVPAIHFIGAGNAVLAAGHELVLCDVDPHTLQATADTLQPCLTDDVRAVLLLHYGGAACGLNAIRGLLANRNIMLIEDAACSVATKWGSRAAGTLGDFGVWSFDAMKVLTCGEGGMVYCADLDDATRLHTATRLGQSAFTGGAATTGRWWEFSVAAPGRRAVFNDVSAAIGRAQLKRLPKMVERRLTLWHRYDAVLAGQRGLRLPPAPAPWVEHSAYFYWVQSPHRDDLAAWLKERDVYTTFRYWPLHRAYGWDDHLPMADFAAARTLLLPLHAGLTDAEQDRICELISEFGRTHP